MRFISFIFSKVQKTYGFIIMKVRFNVTAISDHLLAAWPNIKKFHHFVVNHPGVFEL